MAINIKEGIIHQGAVSIHWKASPTAQLRSCALAIKYCNAPANKWHFIKTTFTQITNNTNKMVFPWKKLFLLPWFSQPQFRRTMFLNLIIFPKLKHKMSDCAKIIKKLENVLDEIFNTKTTWSGKTGSWMQSWCKRKHCVRMLISNYSSHNDTIYT